MQTSGETMQLITMQHLKHKICCENNVTLECFFSIFFFVRMYTWQRYRTLHKIKSRQNEGLRSHERPAGWCLFSKQKRSWKHSPLHNCQVSEFWRQQNLQNMKNKAEVTFPISFEEGNCLAQASVTEAFIILSSSSISLHEVKGETWKTDVAVTYLVQKM